MHISSLFSVVLVLPPLLAMVLRKKDPSRFLLFFLSLISRLSARCSTRVRSISQPENSAQQHSWTLINLLTRNCVLAWRTRPIAYWNLIFKDVPFLWSSSHPTSAGVLQGRVHALFLYLKPKTMSTTTATLDNDTGILTSDADLHSASVLLQEALNQIQAWMLKLNTDNESKSILIITFSNVHAVCPPANTTQVVLVSWSKISWIYSFTKRH